MKIYVINGRRFLILFAIALVFIFSLIALGSFSGSEVLGVFGSNRQLPIYSVESSTKVAAITFDCAWGANDVPDILKTLRDEDIKATFFMVGQWAEKFPEAVKMIAKEGHDVANHSYSHLRMGAIDKNRIRSEISKCGETLQGISGNKVDLFRPPYGDYNDEVVVSAKELGYYTIQWSVDSLDWKPGISQGEIMDRIKRKIHPGAIILFHNDTVHTAKMLPGIIKTLKNEGYGIQPVSKLILRENYKIDYDGTQKPN